MKTLSHLLLISLLPFCAFAQDYKRTFNWYFGDSIGLNFSTVPPSILPKGGLSNAEGSSAVISDTNGQLLFYTDGQTIWNKNHVVMQNGTGLNGSWDATQPAVIVPQPGNDSLYYVFTVDRRGLSKGFQYSIVNMNSNGGLGTVIVKNVLLQTPVCEKVCATKHQNGIDIWVMAHGFGNNTFFAYLLTKDGLLNCPIITNIGTVHDNSGVANAQGAMKFSVKGHKLAVCVYLNPNSKIDLFDFNNNTGQLSNHLPITNIQLPFGLEFSANSKHIYTTTRTNELVTYNISKYNSVDIESSKIIIADYPNLYWIVAGLQLADNAKIYVASPDSFYLGVINLPDSGGFQSDYDTLSIHASGKRIKYGFPNFISSYFYRPNIDFIYSFNCNAKNTYFEAKLDSTQSTLQWRIKKLANGTESFLNIKNFTYNFSDTGLYEIRLIANGDTVIKTIHIDAPLLPQIDTLGCGVDSVLLSIPSSYRCLQWGDTSAQLYTRTIKINGIYVVQGYNSNGCLITDSIKIHFSPTPQQPIITKANDSLYSSPAFNYQWFLNDTALSNANTQSIKPLKAGMYKVLISDSNGCSNISSTFSSNVGIHEAPKLTVSIYPNPAKNSLTIESNESEQNFSLTAITGQKILSGALIKGVNTFNISQLPSGIYFMQIKTDSKTYNQKIIIQ